jgi:hypothetical protein
MVHDTPNYVALSDAEVLSAIQALAGRERECTARLIAMLGELDARRLYLAEGCSSLFTYCTSVLHMSEHAAYGRIEAARATRRWPVVLELLAGGALHLTAITLLSRHLTDENHDELLAAARHKSKREVEEIVAALRPQPAVTSTVRKLPSRAVATRSATAPPAPADEKPHLLRVAPSACLAVPPQPANIRPLAPERYKVQFTASRETYDKLREAQDLLRHRIPNGDVATVIDRALTVLLGELHREKHAAVARPSAAVSGAVQGRHVPARVKRAVWDRDGGQCAFVGSVGRCTERGFLEYHHVVPFAEGGKPTIENLALRCRAHNAYEAERWFGVDLVREARAMYETEGQEGRLAGSIMSPSPALGQASRADVG